MFVVKTYHDDVDSEGCIADQVIDRPYDSQILGGFSDQQLAYQYASQCIITAIMNAPIDIDIQEYRELIRHNHNSGNAKMLYDALQEWHYSLLCDDEVDYWLGPTYWVEEIYQFEYSGIENFFSEHDMFDSTGHRIEEEFIRKQIDVLTSNSRETNDTEQVWLDLCERYLDNLLEREHIKKIDALLHQNDASTVRQGMELLLTFGVEQLCGYLVLTNEGSLVSRNIQSGHLMSAILHSIEQHEELKVLSSNHVFDQWLLEEPRRTPFDKRSVFLNDLIGSVLISNLRFIQTQTLNQHFIQTQQLLVCQTLTPKLFIDWFIGESSRSFNWFDALLFCNLLSEREGLEVVYTGLKDYQIGQSVTNQLCHSIQADHSKNGYRLLTSWEWENAMKHPDLEKSYGSQWEWVWDAEVRGSVIRILRGGYISKNPEPRITHKHRCGPKSRKSGVKFRLARTLFS